MHIKATAAALPLHFRGESQLHAACTLAASAWSTLRRSHPREAERFNGVLHRLTRAKHTHTD
ncbi:MAG: hypothetical protein ACREFT_03190 [Acetobacteraceae bacterium]